MGKGLKRLQEAGNAVGDVAEKVESATKYRTIAEVFMIGGRMPPKRAYAEMRYKYPSGIEDETLMGMITSAHKALSHLTDRPRKIGLAAGLGVSAIVFAAYFFSFRSVLVSTLPQKELGLLIDILLPVIGIGASAILIKAMATNAVKQALRRVADKKSKMPVKMGSTTTLAAIGIVLAYVLVLGASVAAGVEAPFWLQSFLPQTPPQVPF